VAPSAHARGQQARRQRERLEAAAAEARLGPDGVAGAAATAPRVVPPPPPPGQPPGFVSMTPRPAWRNSWRTMAGMHPTGATTEPPLRAAGSAEPAGPFTTQAARFREGAENASPLFSASPLFVASPVAGRQQAPDGIADGGLVTSMFVASKCNPTGKCKTC
jgi:hypothetical protein